MSHQYSTTRLSAVCLAGLVIFSFAPGVAASDRGAVPPAPLTAARVSSAFVSTGLPLRRIRVSPSLPHEVVLYFVNYQAFSLTVFVLASARQAGQMFRDLDPGWKHDGWPSRLLRNIVVTVHPVGAKPGRAARMRPMPTAALQALKALSQRAA